ncbi:hypothetical protein Pint_04547 [Pistacia integerrima]|uniref:Uncharacterized protein n=1 Tax=Pistacia integerrima TaxID=434235 RepID=A0ACC0Z9Y9_9ROSI|nr:hypothetical protein Pint_04547 [Pistacia integerrima]
MANSAARMLLKNGRSFPQLLRSRLVGQWSVDICIKEQQLFRSLINPKQKIFEQKPILGDGFNFVDFVMGKDQALTICRLLMQPRVLNFPSLGAAKTLNSSYIKHKPAPEKTQKQTVFRQFQLSANGQLHRRDVTQKRQVVSPASP